jgi:hypothetical protein
MYCTRCYRSGHELVSCRAVSDVFGNTLADETDSGSEYRNSSGSEYLGSEKHFKEWTVVLKPKVTKWTAKADSKLQQLLEAMKNMVKRENKVLPAPPPPEPIPETLAWSDQTRNGSDIFDMYLPDVGTTYSNCILHGPCKDCDCTFKYNFGMYLFSRLYTE